MSAQQNFRNSAAQGANEERSPDSDNLTNEMGEGEGEEEMEQELNEEESKYIQTLLTILFSCASNPSTWK